jgi:hypothetical protein
MNNTKPAEIKNSGNPKWAKGVSGNPYGRPPKGHPWVEIIDELLACSRVVLTIDKIENVSRTRNGRKSKACIIQTSRLLDIKSGSRKSLREAITCREIEMALSGDMDAIKDLMDRNIGKPRQYVDLGGQQNNPIVHSEVDETIRELLEKLSKSEKDQQPLQKGDHV